MPRIQPDPGPRRGPAADGRTRARRGDRATVAPICRDVEIELPPVSDEVEPAPTGPTTPAGPTESYPPPAPDRGQDPPRREHSLESRLGRRAGPSVHDRHLRLRARALRAVESPARVRGVRRAGPRASSPGATLATGRAGPEHARSGPRPCWARGRRGSGARSAVPGRRPGLARRSRPACGARAEGAREHPGFDLPSAQEILAWPPRRPVPPAKGPARTAGNGRPRRSRSSRGSGTPRPGWPGRRPRCWCWRWASADSCWPSDGPARPTTPRWWPSTCWHGRARRAGRRPSPSRWCPRSPRGGGPRRSTLAKWGVYLGRSASEDDRAEEARRMLEGAVKISPINPTARLAREQLARGRGRPGRCGPWG